MEIDLLKNYPKSKRNLDKRLSEKSPEIVKIAREFGKEFFDGDRKFGYGGLTYHPKYWVNVVKDFVEYYKIKPDAKILDVGCAKGYMVYDFKRQYPGLEMHGVDISEYAIKNCHPEVKDNLQVGKAESLKFEDNYFDLVISINTVHNLELKDCVDSIKEISRVSKGNSFITVDAYNSDEEKERMFKWNLTAKTIMSTNDWKDTFKKIGYNGNFYWFIP
ncbi:class I SAM-dependent methyltransferase [Candidatus Pelagibacter ubique]|nr:class I SAM-dependent methyltransferase [Candidatus Pelagibacter ubique]|tara:strand:+ start:256 stop:909 length:654 start_codon:yes stop_codon:yes gene_type:complete